MNKIHTPGTNLQDKTTTPKKKVVTWNTWSAIEESLSQAPLTTDEKINQLTDQVHNLTLWLNQMIELYKMLMKNQIENSTELHWLTQSTPNFMQSANDHLSMIDKKLQSNEDMLKKLIDIENNKDKWKKIISQLYDYLPPDYNSYYKLVAHLIELIRQSGNINIKYESMTILSYAIKERRINLLSLLYKHPDIDFYEYSHYFNRSEDPSITDIRERRKREHKY